MSDTGDDEKVNCLLNMLEPLVLQKLVKKAFPSKLVNLSYNEIITLLENTFSSFKGREVPNYRYLFRHQFPYESVEHYALALRRLYGKCSPQFKSLIPIKNRFIEGLLDKETKTLLKKDENISFSMAVFIAQEKELPKDQE
ncbi:hypothetical protein M0804_013276 [Polistes exclamans]|nr:hypothetical protein M0804_013276 [Polistes exclamans]